METAPLERRPQAGAHEPERALVRRVAPYGVPAVGLALLLGAAFGGWDVGLSAAIGVALVVANFVVHGLSLAWAARISLTALAATAVVGVVVRLGAIVAAMFLLDRLAFFSPLAFGLAVVASTVALIGFEMKLLAGGVGAELRVAREEEAT